MAFDLDGILDKGYGCFSYTDYYDEVAAAGHSVLVEIGCWLGFSTVYLAKRLPPGAVLYAVDLWTLVDAPAKAIKTYIDREKVEYDLIFKLFMRHLEREGVSDRVVPLRCASVPAAALFDDGSVDHAFIDADHRYPGVRADIKAWLPKVRGTIAGHDFSKRHDGVRRAVDALVPKRNLRKGTVWTYTK